MSIKFGKNLLDVMKFVFIDIAWTTTVENNPAMAKNKISEFYFSMMDSSGHDAYEAEIPYIVPCT